MFSWSDKFLTNIDILDIEHKNLFNLLATLTTKLQLRKIDDEDIESSISILVHYSKNHLHHEELIMREYHIDYRHFSKHIMEHSSFRYDIDRFKNNASSYDRRIIGQLEQIIRFITHWFTFHILSTDLVMAEQLALIKSGKDPQEAYDNIKDHKTDPENFNLMLDSVINLWFDARDDCKRLEESLTKYIDNII